MSGEERGRKTKRARGKSEVCSTTREFKEVDENSRTTREAASVHRANEEITTGKRKTSFRKSFCRQIHRLGFLERSIDLNDRDNLLQTMSTLDRKYFTFGLSSSSKCIY